MVTMTNKGNGEFDIQLTKSFDFECHKDFRSCVHKAMEERASRLTINFQDVEYIDSSALGMLMLAKHETNNINCKLELYNLYDGHARNIINMVKFDQLFTIV